MLGDGVRSVTRHIQALELWVDGLQVIGQIFAIHFRQNYVGNEEINLSGMFASQRVASDGLFATSTV